MSDPTRSEIDAYARKLCVAAGHDPDSEAPLRSDQPDGPVAMVAVPRWALFREQAREELGAMPARLATTPLIEITPQMISAGVDRWREFRFGQDEREIVEAVYLAMEIERRGAGVGEWHPIATAPPNLPVLVWGPGFATPITCVLADLSDGRDWCLAQSDGTPAEENFGDISRPRFAPTHWSMMPEAPAGKVAAILRGKEVR